MPPKATRRTRDPNRPAPEPRPPRRALTHVGGKIEATGADERTIAAARTALEVSSDERHTQAHVHGFHSYPARLHPLTARRLIEQQSKPGATVLDPFCGSGTVLVEASLLGRRAFGIDANPLAIELCWLKTCRASAEQRRALCSAAELVAEGAEQRRLAKAGPKQRYPAHDLSLFEIHMLLELDGLKIGIAELEDPFIRRALGLVLSSLLTKFSRRAGDAAVRMAERRFAGGQAIRFFVKKTEELARRLSSYAERLAPNAPPVEATLGDARELRGIRPGSIDLIVSSPPYPGVYDYYAQHALRLRWLGLNTKFLESRELGSRRELSTMEHAAAVRRWQQDFGACLSSMRRVLRPSGRAALLIADSVAGGRALYMRDLLPPLAERAGFSVLADAAQVRPHFHRGTAHAFRGRPRREHLFVLGGTPRAAR